jgi:hypothetical protein
VRKKREKVVVIIGLPLRRGDEPLTDACAAASAGHLRRMIIVVSQAAPPPQTKEKLEGGKKGREMG